MGACVDRDSQKQSEDLCEALRLLPEFKPARPFVKQTQYVEVMESDLSRGVAVRGLTADINLKSQMKLQLEIVCNSEQGYTQGMHLLLLWLHKQGAAHHFDALSYGLTALYDTTAAQSAFRKLDEKLADTPLGSHFEKLGLFSSSIFAAKMFFSLFIDVRDDEDIAELACKVLRYVMRANQPYPAECLADMLCERAWQVLRSMEDQLMLMYDLEAVIGLSQSASSSSTSFGTSGAECSVLMYKRILRQSSVSTGMGSFSHLSSDGLDDDIKDFIRESSGGPEFFLCHTEKTPDQIYADPDIDGLCKGIWAICFGSSLFFFVSKDVPSAVSVLQKIGGRVIRSSAWSGFLWCLKDCRDLPARPRGKSALRTPEKRRSYSNLAACSPSLISMSSLDDSFLQLPRASPAKRSRSSPSKPSHRDESALATLMADFEERYVGEEVAFTGHGGTQRKARVQRILVQVNKDRSGHDRSCNLSIAELA